MLCARCHLGSDELLLPFLLEGGGEVSGPEHDHVVADHQVARLDRNAGAGHHDAAFPRYVTPAEHGEVDGRVVGGEVQLGQPGGVPDSPSVTMPSAP